MKEPLAHREDLDHMIFSAFRYALGRRTYIVWTTVEFIIHNIDLVPKRFRDLMIREITEAEENHNNGLYKALGDDCDVEQWLKLRAFLKRVGEEK